MVTIIEDFPFTTVLALVGILIGLVLPSSLDILTEYNYSKISEDPAGFLTGYVVGVPLAITIEVISGLIGGLILGIVGLIIDTFRSAFNSCSF